MITAEVQKWRRGEAARPRYSFPRTGGGQRERAETDAQAGSIWRPQREAERSERLATPRVLKGKAGVILLRTRSLTFWEIRLAGVQDWF
jgi:hypothetical protein